MVDSLWITIFLSVVVFSHSTVMRLSVNTPQERNGENKTSNKNLEQKVVRNSLSFRSGSALMTALTQSSSITSSPPSSSSLASKLPLLSRISSLNSYEERRKEFLALSLDLEEEEMEKMLGETALDLTFRKEMFVWIQEIKLRKSREKSSGKNGDKSSNRSETFQIGDYLNEKRFADVFFDNNDTSDANMDEDESETLPKISIFSIICDSSTDGNCSTDDVTEIDTVEEVSTEQGDISQSGQQLDEVYEDHDDFPPGNVMMPDPEKSIQYVDSQEPQDDDNDDDDDEEEKRLEDDEPVIVDRRQTTAMTGQNSSSNQVSFLKSKFLNFRLSPPKPAIQKENSVEKERASNILLVVVFGGLFLFLLVLSIVFLVTRTVSLDSEEAPELTQLTQEQECDQSSKNQLKDCGQNICCGLRSTRSHVHIKDRLDTAWRFCRRPFTQDYIDLY